MGIRLTKDSVDLGIVTRNRAEMVGFYRDVLGFEDLGESQSIVGTMHRLVCGTSAIKLVTPPEPRTADAAPGGFVGATGYRYWTISVPDLAEVLDACEAAGRPVVLPPTVARPGVIVAMVEDPDGNWVEFLQAAPQSG
jgi:catechol 2,3-dioxygenase-like lactoylglutathione lyase family enzyme